MSPVTRTFLQQVVPITRSANASTFALQIRGAGRENWPALWESHYTSNAI